MAVSPDAVMPLPSSRSITFLAGTFLASALLAGLAAYSGRVTSADVVAIPPAPASAPRLGAMDPDGHRWERTRADACRCASRARRTARVHRASSLLSQRRGSDPRRHVPDHVATACDGLAVRDGDGRSVDGSRGRGQGARAPRLRRLRSPRPGSRAAREGRRESVHCEGVPDPAPSRQARRDQLQPDARGRAVPVASARTGDGRASRCRAGDHRRGRPDQEAAIEPTLLEGYRDFVSSVTTSAAAVAAGPLVVAQVHVGDRAAPTQPPAGITLLVDTSASRASGHTAYLASIRRLVGELRAQWGDDLALQIVAFDQTTQDVEDLRCPRDARGRGCLRSRASDRLAREPQAAVARRRRHRRCDHGRRRRRGARASHRGARARRCRPPRCRARR